MFSNSTTSCFQQVKGSYVSLTKVFFIKTFYHEADLREA